MSAKPSKVYAPRPGTAAEKAMNHLAQFPLGTRVEAAQLAEAANVPVKNLTSLLSVAVAHELVDRMKVKKDGDSGHATYVYWLTHGDAFLQDELRGGKPLHRTVPAAEAAPLSKGPATVFDLAAHMQGTPEFNLADEPPASPSPARSGLDWKPGKPLHPALVPVAHEVEHHHEAALRAAVTARPQLHATPAADSAPPPPLECALWSNGELWLRIDGAEPLVLCQAQTKTLIHYLDRLSIEFSPTTTT